MQAALHPETVERKERDYQKSLGMLIKMTNDELSDGLKQLLFDFKTEKWQELTSGTQVGYPNWSHDGKYLYYDNQPGKDAGFYRVRISDHNVERIISLKDVRRASWLFGSWGGLSPDDSPLLLRDVSTQEIYALDLQFP
jgi:hypothetical protein